MSGAWIDLSGQVAAVTGGAAGIGRATVLALAQVGAQVIVLDRDFAGAQAVAGQVGGSACALDVADEGQWREVGEWIEAEFGRLDILVNSAGVALQDSVGDSSLDTYRTTFSVNVEGSLLGMGMALPFMQRQGKGAIVNLSSSAALRGNTLMASYGASKAAIAHFTRSAAIQNLRAGHDIRINAVHPGIIETTMADDLCRIYDKIGSPDAVRAAVSVGRTGRPEEVADLIVFLASDRASYIAGTSIVIDRAANA